MSMIISGAVISPAAMRHGRTRLGPLASRPFVTTALVGQPLAFTPGVWRDALTVTRRIMVGLTEVTLPYTVQAGDDLELVVVEEEATFAEGDPVLASGWGIVRYPLPTLDPIAAIGGTAGDAPATRQATGTGLAGGTWSVSGAGASIDQSGLLTVTRSAPSTRTVIVSYANSGGTAAVSVSVSVAVAPPISAELWTPAELGGDFTLLRFDEPGRLTLSQTGAVTGVTSAAGATVQLASGSNPAQWLAHEGTIDFGSVAGAGLDGPLPFGLAGPRNANGTGDDMIDAVTVVYASIADTVGATAGFRTATGVARYRVGPADVFGVIPGPGAESWADAGAHIRAAQIEVPATGSRLVSAWLDGVPLFTDTATSAGSQTGTATSGLETRGLSLGARADGTNDGQSRLQAIVVVRGVLSLEQRQRVEGWMAWALPMFAGVRGAILPVDHPYRAAAPVTTVQSALPAALAPEDWTAAYVEPQGWGGLVESDSQPTNAYRTEYFDPERFPVSVSVTFDGVDGPETINAILPVERGTQTIRLRRRNAVGVGPATEARHIGPPEYLGLAAAPTWTLSDAGDPLGDVLLVTVTGEDATGDSLEVLTWVHNDPEPITGWRTIAPVTPVPVLPPGSCTAEHSTTIAGGVDVLVTLAAVGLANADGVILLWSSHAQAQADASAIGNGVEPGYHVETVGGVARFALQSINGRTWHLGIRGVAIRCALRIDGRRGLFSSGTTASAP